MFIIGYLTHVLPFKPFSHVLVDWVSPLPKTKLGNQYLLTIMRKATRFPEAVLLRNINKPKIVESLINLFSAADIIWHPEVITHMAICLTFADKYFYVSLHSMHLF